MFLGKKLRTSSPAKCHITPYNWLEQLKNVHGQRKARNMVENLTSLEGPSCYIRKTSFENRTWTRCTLGQPGDIQEQEIQNRFLFAADPRLWLGERAPPSRVRGVRKSHQRKRARTMRRRSKQRSPSSSRQPRQTLGQKNKQEVQGIHTFLESP